MLLRRKLGKIILAIPCDTYNKYVTYTNYGRELLYVVLTNTLYGILKADLLFYRNIWSNLKVTRLNTKPLWFLCHKRVIYGRQCILNWDAEKLKILQGSAQVVSDIIYQLKGKYRGIQFSCGMRHDYLRMDLYFTNMRKVNT